MRQVIALSVCLLISLCAAAQFQTGQGVLGGQFSFSHNDYYPNPSSSNEQRSTYIAPGFSLSHFTSPTSLSGFGVSYQYTRSKTLVGVFSNEQINYAHSIGAFWSAAKLKPLVKNLYLAFTGTLGISYNFGKNYTTYNVVHTDQHGYSLYGNAGLGIYYQLNQRWLLTGGFTNLLAINFAHNDYKYYATATVVPTSTGKNESVSFSSGLSDFTIDNIVFGVKYLLKNKKGK